MKIMPNNPETKKTVIKLTEKGGVTAENTQE